MVSVSMDFITDLPLLVFITPLSGGGLFNKDGSFHFVYQNNY
jgi:hypothetical protein